MAYKKNSGRGKRFDVLVAGATERPVRAWVRAYDRQLKRRHAGHVTRREESVSLSGGVSIWVTAIIWDDTDAADAYDATQAKMMSRRVQL